MMGVPLLTDLPQFTFPGERESTKEFSALGSLFDESLYAVHRATDPAEMQKITYHFLDTAHNLFTEFLQMEKGGRATIEISRVIKTPEISRKVVSSISYPYASGQYHEYLEGLKEHIGSFAEKKITEEELTQKLIDDVFPRDTGFTRSLYGFSSDIPDIPVLNPEKELSVKDAWKVLDCFVDLVQEISNKNIQFTNFYGDKLLCHSLITYYYYAAKSMTDQMLRIRDTITSETAGRDTRQMVF